MVAWTDAMVRGIDTYAEGPVMTLHFTRNPEPTGHEHRSLSRCWWDLRAGTAAMGVASYYHPEGGTPLAQPGTDPLDAPQRRKPEPRVCYPGGNELRREHPGPGLRPVGSDQHR